MDMWIDEMQRRADSGTPGDHDHVSNYDDEVGMWVCELCGYGQSL